MADIIIIAVVILIVGLAAGYVYKAKKKGAKCIGCPESCNCGSKDSGCCSGCQDLK